MLWPPSFSWSKQTKAKKKDSHKYCSRSIHASAESSLPPTSASQPFPLAFLQLFSGHSKMAPSSVLAWQGRIPGAQELRNLPAIWDFISARRACAWGKGLLGVCTCCDKEIPIHILCTLPLHWWGERGERASGCMALTCQVGLTHDSSHLMVSFYTHHLFFPVLKHMEIDCFGRKRLSDQYQL